MHSSRPGRRAGLHDRGVAGDVQLGPGLSAYGRTRSCAPDLEDNSGPNAKAQPAISTADLIVPTAHTLPSTHGIGKKPGWNPVGWNHATTTIQSDPFSTHLAGIQIPTKSPCTNIDLSQDTLRSLDPGADSIPHVVVTGGGGRTGRLVTKKLAERSDKFDVVATVRSAQAKTDLASSLGLAPSNVEVWDISEAGKSMPTTAPAFFKGAHAMIVVTSAVPEIVPKPEGAPPGPPNFVWKGGQAPEQVDWLGQKVQIDCALEAGLKHVVIVGSMGGTDPGHMLNKIAGDGNILQWKRKAEQYLIQSGLGYTIIHPGGLLDEEGGQRKLVLGVDDELSTKPQGKSDKPYRTIPRGDVAELCIQALLMPEAMNVALDAVSVPPEEGDGSVTTDFGALFGSLKEGSTYDYSINSQW
eukprot:gene24945-10599_t